MQINKGFTLAEVLITLGIIGVVAALTIPVLMNNIRNKELESRFKKTSSELQTALQKVQYDEGTTIYGNITSQKGELISVILKQFKSPAKEASRYDITVGKIKGKDIIYKNFDGVNDFYTYGLDDGTI